MLSLASSKCIRTTARLSIMHRRVSHQPRWADVWCVWSDVGVSAYWCLGYMRTDAWAASARTACTMG
jgi:hypothetical protein